LSLLLEVGSQNLAKLDWAVVRVLDDDTSDGFATAALKLLRALADSDPLRAEAMLHAWPHGTPPYGADYKLARFGTPQRQQEVLAAKHEIAARGITSKFDDVRAVAEDAYADYNMALARVEASMSEPPLETVTWRKAS
jgi:hypothetical protein